MGSLVEGGGAHYAMPRDEDIDEFLNKVNDVTEKVQDILSGKITVEEIQQEEKKLLLKEKIKQMREAEKKEEERRRYVMGTEGSGTKERNYKCFCTHCLVEFNYILTKCPRCSGGVITKEQRLLDLQEKVNQYKEKKKKRDARRAFWKKWKSGINQNKDSNEGKIIDKDVQNDSPHKIATTDYDKWNHYEPSSDTFDEDEKIPYVPKDNKDFKILEKKLQSDIDKKNHHRKIAHSIKLKGNDFFTKKKYIQALESYEEALQICKDYLEIYNNVALCYLKTYRYHKAIHSCNEIIKYYDVFKGDFHIKKDTLFKSHLRKGFAWYKLYNFEEALASFQSALEFCPGDVEASVYLQKCERMMRKGTQLGGAVSPKDSSPPGQVNNGNINHGNINHANVYNENVQNENVMSGNVEEDTMDLSHALNELAKMDLTKDGKIFLETLKGVKKSLKRSEEAKLAFYLNVYSIDYSRGGTCGGVATRKGRTTFLAFCADKLEEVLFCVKREQSVEISLQEKHQQLEGGNTLPKYTSLIAIALIDLITFILDEHHQFSDFCLSAVNPVITLYQLRRINKVKAVHLLNSIGRDTEGRKLLHERIIQQEDHALMGMFLSRIGYLIGKERSVYTREQNTRMMYLAECVVKMEHVRKYEVDLRGVIQKGEKTDWGNSTTRPPTEKSKTNKGSNTSEWLQKRAAKMYKHKLELANLFGIISHLTLKQDGRDVLEKEFMKDILNIIIYVNELFYSYQSLNCNCLSVLVNLVSSTKFRTIIMSASWPHMLHFVEKWLQGTPPGDDLLENVLSLIFNLTSTWKEQIRKGDGESFRHGEKTLIRESSLRRMISCMGSTNMRVAELCYLIVSRFYTYAYSGVVDIEGKSVGSPPGKEERVCPSYLFTSTPIGKTSNENRNVQLVDSLKRKIEKENDHLVHLDEFSFDSMKKSILSELESPRGGGLTSACIYLLCCLSKYTDFLFKLLHGEEVHLERLSNRLVSLFVEKKSKVQRDQSTSIMVKNIATFFTQMIKIIIVREDTDWESVFLVKSIERVIPHAVELVNNGIHNDATSKEISFFLSYCFVNAHFKSAVLASFHNDVGRICAVLRCGGG
ncbi:conserved Plasmodium protein, unknown function [Plasmodium knowlesi strain H]|uniref:Uncharacterized protein n=3 Tax=Plasmodium knowlesi TaxID=5850 RepID=A0A5K1V060_PLAKH|nr:tetratricopeptide repeat protein, putative [Plasmodium knowlesi strain H]OTN65933.1 Uncharacterized protein PKNOH_S100059000 [Plasmodium knowlesi]CAA9987943.1 tetratricopeptide repeat protein, putative [Plasmodium knowlesi strain H]SBO22191.1 conserved Plasmodium protein, unknown function [Plasmodium knowlesi strain H]SBO29198.1 conserved Plasmodium protein, unknown function [Plasmodium knowlesi strain H]VVS77417.1 tetratricopeptide repeat protein, putative [Plasmodium knowlesi strain H]|eukprot:XP_002258923.1 hypothetical protein, conserved in Plasmodium species [Plasmodium knowlesi strain H]